MDLNENRMFPQTSFNALRIGFAFLQTLTNFFCKLSLSGRSLRAFDRNSVL